MQQSQLVWLAESCIPGHSPYKKTTKNGRPAINCPHGLFCFLFFSTRFSTLAFIRPSPTIASRHLKPPCHHQTGVAPATPESGAKPDAFIGRLRNLSGVPDSRSHTASETQFVPLGISRQLLCFRVLCRKGSWGKGRVRAGRFVPGFSAVLSHFQAAKTRKMAIVRIKSGMPVLGRFGTLFWKNARFHAR